jgi:hypothetical protein
MPLFNMDSEKLWAGEYWTNRFVIQGPTLADALVTADAIRDIEIAVHTALVTLTKYRVSDQVENTDVYQVIQDNAQGARATNGQALPHFCRVRCDFNAIGGGRPSRKYVLAPLFEAEQDAGVLVNDAIAFYLLNYVSPLVNLVAFVDVDGQGFSGGSVSRQVGMRQLRRGSKRKLLPIIV